MSDVVSQIVGEGKKQFNPLHVLNGLGFEAICRRSDEERFRLKYFALVRNFDLAWSERGATRLRHRQRPLKADFLVSNDAKIAVFWPAVFKNIFAEQ